MGVTNAPLESCHRYPRLERFDLEKNLAFLGNQCENLHGSCKPSSSHEQQGVSRIRHIVNPCLIQVKAPCAPDKNTADASSQRSNVLPVTNPSTCAFSSIPVGVQGANPEVPSAHGADTRCLPQTQVHTVPLATVPPNQHTLSSKSIATTVPSPPAPTSPVPLPLVHAHRSPITVTSHTMTQSSSPLLAHHSKPPATQELQKNMPSHQAPTLPGSFPGTNPQLASNNVKPPPIQNRTKVDKPAQDGKGPTKSMKTSFSISSFTQMFKPPSMPRAFPGPQMDMDWVMVSQGPTEIQGRNWLKQLFCRPS